MAGPALKSQSSRKTRNLITNRITKNLRTSRTKRNLKIRRRRKIPQHRRMTRNPAIKRLPALPLKNLKIRRKRKRSLRAKNRRLEKNLLMQSRRVFLKAMIPPKRKQQLRLLLREALPFREKAETLRILLFTTHSLSVRETGTRLISFTRQMIRTVLPANPVKEAISSITAMDTGHSILATVVLSLLRMDMNLPDGI